MALATAFAGMFSKQDSNQQWNDLYNRQQTGLADVDREALERQYSAMQNAYVVERAPDAPTAPLVKPVSFMPDLPALDDMTEYKDVAETLGFNPPELVAHMAELNRRELLGFCLDHGYLIYDNKAVTEYMSGLAAKDGKWFVWKRLDVKNVTDNPSRLAEHGRFSGAHYKKPVPKDILIRASTVKKMFGDQVQIYVSDYEVVNPDPFICAKLRGSEHVVFGMWDEPGFKAIGRDEK